MGDTYEVGLRSVHLACSENALETNVIPLLGAACLLCCTHVA